MMNKEWRRWKYCWKDQRKYGRLVEHPLDSLVAWGLQWLCARMSYKLQASRWLISGQLTMSGLLWNIEWWIEIEGAKETARALKKCHQSVSKDKPGHLIAFVPTPLSLRMKMKQRPKSVGQRRKRRFWKLYLKGWCRWKLYFIKWQYLSITFNSC